MTNVERSRRNLGSVVCSICHSAPKNILHVLRDCKMVKSAWYGLLDYKSRNIFYMLERLGWFSFDLGNQLGKFKPYEMGFNLGWYCHVVNMELEELYFHPDFRRSTNLIAFVFNFAS